MPQRPTAYVTEAIVCFQLGLLDLVTQLMHNQEESLQLGAFKRPHEIVSI